MAGRDPVTALRAYLMESPELAGIPVGVAIPVLEDADEVEREPVDANDYPEKFIQLMLSGESRVTIVHRESLVTVEVWHKGGEAAASKLMQVVYDLVDNWPPVHPFDGIESGPFSYPDVHSGISRYMMTVNVFYRSDQLL